VLPKYENVKYVNISVGNNFGIEDIVGSIIKNEEIDQDEWMQHKDKIMRQFTVQGTKLPNEEGNLEEKEEGKSMLLSLSVNDVNRMQLEFNEIY
jgi:hypothetical protein